MIFQGKRLLLLGSNLGILAIIKYAKDHGAVTIVADNRPIEKSVGKLYADENLMISTADIDGLKNYIRKNRVDGIFAGISEFNLLKAMELCNYFGLPFYCTKQQWDSVANKLCFRNLCLQHHIPCPKTLFSGHSPASETIQTFTYPVVVKPVDAAASRGVSICNSRAELERAIPLAIDQSAKGDIIIEEFFEGEEFTAHYTIARGEATLSSLDSRFPVAINEGAVTTVPIARIYPSAIIDQYLARVNDKVIDLCKSLGINTGVLFIQGFYNSQTNQFSIFEGGLRCAGEAVYRIIEKVNGVSFMNNLVDYALLGKVSNFDAAKEDPYLKGKHCCVTSFASKGGKIGKIIGYNEIASKVPSIVASEMRYNEGDITPQGNTLSQIVLRFVLVCDTQENLVRDIETINSSIKVLGENGEDICYRFDARTHLSQTRLGTPAPQASPLDS